MHKHAQVADAEICNAISFSVFETLHQSCSLTCQEKSSEKLNMRHLLFLYLANIYLLQCI